MVHLDTNVAIETLNRKRPEHRARFEQLRRSSRDVSISSIVVFELWYGVAKSLRVADSARGVRAFLGEVDVHPFSADDAIAAGEIRAGLKKAGTPIGSYDLLIAAQAVRAGATLITANVREFSRVPGLKWEDWSA